MNIQTLIKLLFIGYTILFNACSKEVETPSTDTYIESIKLTASDLLTETVTQVGIEIMPSNVTNNSVTWKSSDPATAIVSSSGLVKAYKNGEVTITATAADPKMVSGSVVIKISSFETVDSNNLKVSTVKELLDAVANVKKGQTITVAGGVYKMSSRLNLRNSGSDLEKIKLIGDPANRPKLDFSTFPEGSSNQGIVLSADHWIIKGLDIYKTGDNGMSLSGNNNVIEYCTFSECADSGLQLSNGASNNTILNCDSYFNADSKIENADGFAAKIDVGSGNKFIGCRAWQNLDDGWDGYLRGTDNVTTTYEHCWAIKNGILKNGNKSGGDGNGFKTGGSDDKLLKHNAFYTNCIAAGNVVDGFDHNSNRGEISIINCGSYGNGKNLTFGNTNAAAKLTVKNTAAVTPFGSTNAQNTDITNNSWQNSLEATAADYESLMTDQLLAPRKPDGSLPDVTFMKLKSDSDLINKGFDVGLPFKGSSPDIGPFEFTP